MVAKPTIILPTFFGSSVVQSRRYGLAEGPEGQRQVDEGVLELVQGLVSLHDLVQFQTHEPRYHRRGGGNGRNDFTFL